MRLDKYLAETAQCTRSEAKALLAKGRVTVNGAVCRKGDTQLKEADAVAVDGKALAYRQFDQATAPELVEACIYRISAAKARCDYYLRVLKAQEPEAAGSVRGGALWT